MNIDEIIVRHSTLTNGTAGLLISLITCSETAVPIRIGSISLYFPDCMFGEDRSRLTVGCETNLKGVGGGLYPLHSSKYASIVEIVFESKNQKYNVAWLKVVCSLSAGMVCY